MTDNTLELCWDHFETNAPKMFRNLWNDQDFADVTLATVDDQQIRAHKVILSSCSQFFRNIFLMNPHQNPLLYLKGIRYKELALISKIHLPWSVWGGTVWAVRLPSYRKWAESGRTDGRYQSSRHWGTCSWQWNTLYTRTSRVRLKPHRPWWQNLGNVQSEEWEWSNYSF